MSLESAVLCVLPHFPGLEGVAPPIFLGNHCGFSGALLWRVERQYGGDLCIRAWPPSMTVLRLESIHGVMMNATGRRDSLPFVPQVHFTWNVHSWVEEAGRLWDVTAWMPGRADFHQHPSRARLEAACTALAQLHLAWANRPLWVKDCPAVQRRFAHLADWNALVRGGWRPLQTCAPDDPVRPFAELAWTQLERYVPAVERLLAPWQERRTLVQPCLCDPWHDHILFKVEAVSGIVDYGSYKMDHIAVDVARMLGSLIGDDTEMWRVGLEAYACIRPLTAEDRHLVKVLDRTGTLLGAANWLRWLFHDGRTFENRTAVADRLATLVRRMERWNTLGDTAH